MLYTGMTKSEAVDYYTSRTKYYNSIKEKELKKKFNDSCYRLEKVTPIVYNNLGEENKVSADKYAIDIICMLELESLDMVDLQENRNKNLYAVYMAKKIFKSLMEQM